MSATVVGVVGLKAGSRVELSVEVPDGRESLCRPALEDLQAEVVRAALHEPRWCITRRGMSVDLAFVLGDLEEVLALVNRWAAGGGS